MAAFLSESGRNSVFTSSLICETSISFNGSCPSTTIGSADSLDHRKQIYSKASPGKALILLLTPALSTSRSLLTMCFTVMWLLTHSDWPLYTIPVRPALNLIGGWNRALQSRFLQCIPHSKPPCDLLILPGTTQAYEGLTPSGIICYLR